LLYLHGLGHWHPPNIIDNNFLESLDIGVDPAWIDERVGICERRTLMDLDYIRKTKNLDTRMAPEASSGTSTEMAQEAASLALERSGLRPAQIGMVVAGGCTPTMLIPAEGCRVAAALGIDGIAFDINSACSTFIAQISLIDKIGPALPDFVMLVQTEVFTRFTDYSDRKTAVLFGDGAAVAIVSAKHWAPLALTATSFHTAAEGCDLITIPTSGHFRQDGHAVQKFAVRKTVDGIASLRAQQASGAGRNLFVGHQANLRMLETVCRLANVPEAEHKSNVAMFGNCGAAGGPTVLSQLWDELPDSSTSVVLVGSGLAWGGLQVIPAAPAGAP
jgi:3-oxoacyl-[acyl-carrier-protein] synthase-3